MSGLQNITYQQIVDAVKTYIKTSCINITNYAGINNLFKNGYSSTSTISGGNAEATCYCTIRISGNEIQQAYTTDVDTDMADYLDNIYVTSYLNTYIKDSELIKFLNDMLIFCATRLAYSTSMYSPSLNYLIYRKKTSTSDFSWQYASASTLNMNTFNHLRDSLGRIVTDYYKCTSREEGGILYSTKTSFTPDDFNQGTYNYIMDYIAQHGELPSGETDISDQNISDEYVLLSQASPLVYNISGYTYSYDGTDFTPLADTEASAYIGCVLYDEEHYEIDPADYIETIIYTAPQYQETIGSYTITYYLGTDGTKICLPDMEQTVLNIYNESHVCTYYILDIDNNRFKYPIGYNPDEYPDIELIESGEIFKQIDYTDASSIINAVVNISKQSIRSLPVQYSLTYS